MNNVVRILISQILECAVKRQFTNIAFTIFPCSCKVLVIYLLGRNCCDDYCIAFVGQASAAPAARLHPSAVIRAKNQASLHLHKSLFNQLSGNVNSRCKTHSNTVLVRKSLQQVADFNVRY